MKGPMCSLRTTLISISLLFFAGSGAAAPAPFTLKKVVAAGEEAPQGGTFIQFEPMGINPDGTILFEALVKQERDFRAIYLSHDSSLARVAAIGDTTPDGGTLIGFSNEILNSQGHVVFLGSAKGRMPRAIFLRDGAGLKKVVVVREHVPGVGTLREFSDVTFNDSDAIGFVGRVVRGKVPRALMLASSGALQNVLAVGDPTPLGGRFAQITSPSINSRGEIAFEGTVFGGRSPSGIFVVSKSEVRKVVVVGDPSPLGGSFKDLALPMINDHRDVAFWAALEGARVPSGLFLVSQGSIEKVAARGDPAPGGGRLSYIGLSYSLEGRVVAFQARITDGAAGAGIFLSEKEALTAVVRVGDPTPVGGRFSGLSGPEMSPNGTVAFAGEVQGGRAASGLFLAIPKR
ncbi:MAG: choice-of-anchor tandem repeat NxxGxxAF-containing protein [Candidatus Binatia bacterium]